MKRIYSIDFTRGLVMIIMALDHTRDLLHVNSVTQSPSNLLTTTPWLFFTRWITYLCAPTFVFLAGTAAYLSFKSKADSSASRQFLLKRGVWLIVLEFTLVNFALWFDLGFHNFIFEVIATIGFGFIMLGLLLRIPSRTIGIIGLLIIFLHGLFALIPFAENSFFKTILSPLFGLGRFPLTTHINFTMAYPPVPWLGIMLAGFAAGKLFESAPDKRKKIFVRIGAGALVLFIVLRFVNMYGDPLPWGIQKNSLYTFLSFMNISKYPPSLLFCLITLGIMFLMLAFAETIKPPLINIVSVYGKTPLFYFLLHFYLIHVIMIAVMLLQGFHWADLDFAGGIFGRPAAKKSGVTLWVVYIVWISVVLVLYKPCLWFGRYKATHQQFWLKYI